GQLIITWRALPSNVMVQIRPPRFAVPLHPGIVVPLTTQSGALFDVGGRVPFITPLMEPLIATPFASVITVTGSGIPSNCKQLRPFASYVATKRCSRKVRRELATAGSGDGLTMVKGASSNIRWGPIARRCAQ